ncbi:MAG: hypothetical protein ACPGO5_04770 [Patescibacteria group bacterium]
MGKFWQSSEPPKIPLKKHLTSTEQHEIFRALKMDNKDIKSLKKAMKSKPQGQFLLNRGKQLSLGEMEDLVHQHDPKLAKKLKTGFSQYEKNVKQAWEERAATDASYNDIKSNIKRTRKFDIKRERSKEYMKERLQEEKMRGLDPDAPKEHKDRHGKYHTLDKPTTSAKASQRSNSWSKYKEKGDETETSAQGKMRETKTIDEIKEKAKNLPELPI